MFYKSLRYGLKEIFNTLICECIALLQLILPCALLSVTNGIAKAHWNILLSSPLYQHRLKRDCYLKVLITTEFDLLCLPFLQNTKVGRGERENLSKVVGTGVKTRIIHTLSRCCHRWSAAARSSLEPMKNPATIWYKLIVKKNKKKRSYKWWFLENIYHLTF